MFEKFDTKIPGCYLLKPRVFADKRGLFVKLFHSEWFENIGLKGDFKEEYFSTSIKGVIRGLHFQTPPDQHVKCITCLQGEIFDVVVDLRKNSPTFGQHLSVLLNSKDPMIFYVAEGMAHGFMTLSENSVFLNKTTTVYSPEQDNGIRWDSCGIQWPDIPSVVSEKDENLIALESFKSPF